MDTELKNETFNKKYKVTLPQLHAGQKQVAESNARFKVLSAGRRWGKTRLGVWLCLEKAWKGGRAWWIAPTYAMALEGWKDLRNIGIEYGTIIKESEKTVIMPTGGSVSIRSADNPDRLRGARRTDLFINECNNVDFESTDVCSVGRRNRRRDRKKTILQAYFVSESVPLFYITTT